MHHTGREHSILQHVILTPDVYQLCHGVGHSLCQKWELLFIMPRVKFNGKYCWYGLLPQQMLDAIKCVVRDNFVF